MITEVFNLCAKQKEINDNRYANNGNLNNGIMSHFLVHLAHTWTCFEQLICEKSRFSSAFCTCWFLWNLMQLFATLPILISTSTCHSWYLLLWNFQQICFPLLVSIILEDDGHLLFHCWHVGFAYFLVLGWQVVSFSFFCGISGVVQV